MKKPPIPTYIAAPTRTKGVSIYLVLFIIAVIGLAIYFYRENVKNKENEQRG